MNSTDQIKVAEDPTTDDIDDLVGDPCEGIEGVDLDPSTFEVEDDEFDTEGMD